MLFLLFDAEGTDLAPYRLSHSFADTLELILTVADRWHMILAPSVHFI